MSADLAALRAHATLLVNEALKGTLPRRFRGDAGELARFAGNAIDLPARPHARASIQGAGLAPSSAGTRA